MFYHLINRYRYELLVNSDGTIYHSNEVGPCELKPTEQPTTKPTTTMGIEILILCLEIISK